MMRRIGSKTPTVRRHYLSYRLLLQMIDSLEDFPVKEAEGRFSVMSLSLRTHGVQQYLDIDIFADPKAAKLPVPQTHLDALANFSRWLFGSQDQPPLFGDSRRIDDFGRILKTLELSNILKGTRGPNLTTHSNWQVVMNQKSPISSTKRQTMYNLL